MPETTNVHPSPPTATRDNALSLVRWIALVAIAGVALGLAMSWLAQRVTLRSPVAASASDAGGAYPAPDFRLPSLTGGQLGPPDYLGKVVVIDFWASWCGPCRVQAELLDELAGVVDPAQVQFLAVNVGEDEATVRSYVEKTPFPYPVVLDPNSSLGNTYPLHGLPTMMVINKQGAVTFLRTGITDKSTLQAEMVEAGLET